MQFTSEAGAESQVTFSFEVPWNEFETYMDKAYKKVVQKVNIPGFRRGKAPRAVLERTVGRDSLQHDAIDITSNEAYRKAIQESKTEPISQPEFESIQFEEGQPFLFKITVTVRPEVQIGDYHAIKFERTEVTVEDSDVDKTIEQVRESYPQISTPEEPRAAREGDLVTVAVNGQRGEGEDAVTALDRKDWQFVLDPKADGPEAFLVEHVVGLNQGESKTFTLPFPVNGPPEQQQETTFTVTLNLLQDRTLLPLDDEFAKTVGDFTTMDELRATVREQLQQRRESEEHTKLENDVIEAAMEQAEVDIPQVMIQEETEDYLEEVAEQARRLRLSLEDYFKITRKTEEEYRKSVEPEVRRKIKRMLVLNTIAINEKLEITNGEIDQELIRLAESMGRTTDVQQLLRSEPARQRVAGILLRGKAAHWLVDNATGAVHDHGAEPAETEEQPSVPTDTETTSEAEAHAGA